MRHTNLLSRLGAAAGIAALLVTVTAGPAAAEESPDDPVVEDTTVAHPDPDQPVSDDGLEYTTQVVNDDGSEVADPTAELDAPVLEEQVSITGEDAAGGQTSLVPVAAAGALVLLAGAGGAVALRRRTAVTHA